MRGKAGLVIGLGVGYVLGTRAGRQRYEQIAAAARKVWQLDPVQSQVAKVKAFGMSALRAVPNALWDGAKRVTSAASGAGTVPEKAQRASGAAKTAAHEVAEALDESVDAAETAGKTPARTTSSRSGTSARSSSRGPSSRS